MNNKMLVDNIKKLCQDYNITISQLEKELYMSPGLISRWTKNIPSFDRVVDIANYFNVSLDTIVNNNTTNSDNSIINHLLFLLFQKSIDAEIEWNIWDYQNIPAELENNFPDILECPIGTDAFYCKVNHGYFFIVVKYVERKELNLSLYILADQNSKPELKCTETDKLMKLYTFLNRRFSKQLNSMKTNNFIETFINNNTTTNYDNITPIKQAQG